jgi:hypothetical protein
MDQTLFNLKLGLYRYRAIWILIYEASYTKYTFKCVEKPSLILAFTSPRRGIEAAFFLRITEHCVSFPFAVMVNVARIAYGKDVVHKDGDSYDVGTTGKYDSDRNLYSNIQTRATP